MYETMAVHPLNWIYYLTFIFLNMMVGTVLEVMSQEHELFRAEQHGESGDGGEPASRAQIDKLEKELAEIKALLLENKSLIKSQLK